MIINVNITEIATTYSPKKVAIIAKEYAKGNKAFLQKDSYLNLRFEIKNYHPQ